MITTPEKYKVVEKRVQTAPALPTNRPPTKAEVWAYWEHIYSETKTRDELITEAKADWAWKYTSWWLRGWRKQPDWVEGDAVIDDAVPHFIDTANWQRAVNTAWQTAQERRAA